MLGVLGFVAEIVVFAAVGIAAFRLSGGGTDGAVIAASAVVAAVIVWAVLMAPGASHRLPAAGRVAVVLAAGGGAAAVLAVSGAWQWPALTSAAVLVLLPTTRSPGEPGPEHVGRHARGR